MTFLNPQAFWGLSLLIIPILIHLFNFRRYKKVLFSNLAFLTEVKSQKQSSSTLKKLLILACREFLIFFLVLAFAQPTLYDETSAPSESSLVYFDNSLSMQQVDPSGEPLLFSANNVLLNWLDNTTSGNVRIMSNDALINYTDSDLDLSAFQNFSTQRSYFEDIISKKELYGNKGVIIISDFQQNSANLNLISEDTSTAYEMYQILSGLQNNLFIDSVFLMNSLGLGEESILTIRLINSGDTDASDGLVTIKKEDRQLSSQTFTIGANGSLEIKLPLEHDEAIYGSYVIELSDVPIVFDNEFYFHISQPERSKIVLLEDEKTVSGDYIQKLYENQDLFNFSRERINSTSLSRISDAELVIVSEIAVFPNWLISQMDQLKGRLLTIPSLESDAKSYEDLLQLKLTSQKGFRKKVLNSKSLAHPFLKGAFIKDQSDRVSLPDFTPIFQVNGYYEDILETNEGQPVLSRLGKRNIFLLNSPLGDDYTSFHKHALFVPIMYRLAQNDIESPLFYRLDEEYIDIATDSIVNNSLVKLSVGDQVFIPAYRFSTRGITIEIPSDMNKPGVYLLTNETDTLDRLAFNYSLKESDIATYSSNELQKFADENTHVSYFPINSNSITSASLNINNESESLWKYALLLALSFIVIESILLRFLK